MKVMTKDNTKLAKWRDRANRLFAARGMRSPRLGEARDAFEMGESPETYLGWVVGGVSVAEWNSSVPA